MKINLVENGRAIPLLVETAGLEGVRRIAAAVAEDICLVSGVRPEVVSEELLKSTAVCHKILQPADIPVDLFGHRR